MRLETGAPLVIFAPRDESSMKAMAPAFWKAPGPKPAGLFQHGWERQYAVIRLDQDIPGKYNVVYHEYVHTLLHANFRWLPTWLDEGLAEFYGNSRFEQTKMYVGAPSTRVYRLQGATLIKVDELISENPWVKFRKDEQQIDLFYSEAWALVHYLIFGPGMEQGKKLDKFYKALLQGEDQKKAFQEVFGSFQDVQEGLSNYTRKFMFSSYVLENPPQLKEKEFPSRVTCPAETDAELGAYRSVFSRSRRRTRLHRASPPRRSQCGPRPRDSWFSRTLPMARIKTPTDEFTKAYAARSTAIPIPLLQNHAFPLRTRRTAPADESALRAAMYDVLKANPRFAPAFIELALMAAQRRRFARRPQPRAQGRNLGTLARRVSPARRKTSPRLRRRSGSWKTSELRGRPLARARSRRSHGIVEQYSCREASSGRSPPLDTPSTTLTSQGTLRLVICGEKENGTSLVIQNPLGTQTFRSSGAHIIGYLRHPLVRHGPFHSLPPSRRPARHRGVQAQHR